MAVAQDEVARLSRDLEIRVREVEKLNRDVAELTEALRIRGGEVEELNRTVGRLVRDLETRGREVEELNRQLAARVAAAAPAFPPASAPAVARVRAPAVPPPRRLDLLGAVWTLVRTDLKVRYHGSLGGFAWTLLKPLTMLGVLLGVFSFIFGKSPDYALNLIVGLFLWDYFVEGTRVGLTSLAAKGYLLAKTRFPRWIPVVTSSASALLTAVVFTVALCAVLALAHRPPSLLALALVGLYLLQLVLIVVGFSLAASVLFLRYRDLDQFWEMATHAGFFLAPIVYPLSILPERFHFWLYLWPPTPVIQYVRSALVTGVVPSARAHLLLASVTVVVLAAGVLVFRRFAPDAAEHV